MSRLSLHHRLLLGASVCLSLLNPCGAATVSTQQGAVSGVAARVPGVTLFKGLPYAAPPVGALRWAPPQAPAGWTGVRHADHFGPTCPQNPSKADPAETADVTPSPMAEDCLYLNIWTPNGATAGKRLPVLVWIHGGAFQIGSGSLPLYDGSALASGGIVVITLNYRLGVLGYLAHPLLTAQSLDRSSGNYALLDQIAALRWIRANVAGFGGDPARVTIAGHSGGGISVGTLMVSPLARGLFDKAIIQSGPLEGLAPPTRDLATAEEVGQRFMDRRGATSLEQMRSLPTADLVRRLPDDPTPYGPIVDGHAITEQPADSFIAGRQAPIPLMIGVTSGEGGSMTATDPTPDSFRRFVGWLYGDQAAAILAAYPHATPAQARDSHAWLKRDQMMAATRAFANCHRRLVGATFVYLFDHSPPGPDAAWRRAYHGAELQYLFGTRGQFNRPWTDADQQIEAQIQSYWRNFVNNGDPNADDLPPWSAFDGTMPGLRLSASGDAVTPAPSFAQLDRFFAPDDPHVRPFDATPFGFGCT